MCAKANGTWPLWVIAHLLDPGSYAQSVDHGHTSYQTCMQRSFLLWLGDEGSVPVGQGCWTSSSTSVTSWVSHQRTWFGICKYAEAAELSLEAFTKHGHVLPSAHAGQAPD